MNSIKGEIADEKQSDNKNPCGCDGSGDVSDSCLLIAGNCDKQWSRRTRMTFYLRSSFIFMKALGMTPIRCLTRLLTVFHLSSDQKTAPHSGLSGWYLCTY